MFLRVVVISTPFWRCCMQMFDRKDDCRVIFKLQRKSTKHMSVKQKCFSDTRKLHAVDYENKDGASQCGLMCTSATKDNTSFVASTKSPEPVGKLRCSDLLVTLWMEMTKSILRRTWTDISSEGYTTVLPNDNISWANITSLCSCANR